MSLSQIGYFYIAFYFQVGIDRAAWLNEKLVCNTG